MATKVRSAGVPAGRKGVVVVVLRRACAALLIALLAGGCGLGDRQARADAIIESANLAFQQGTATGTLSTSVRLVRLPDGAGTALGGIGAPSADDDRDTASDPLQAIAQQQQAAMERAFTVVASLDLSADRASVSLPDHESAFAIYEGLVAYGRRWSAGPRDARPWVRVDSAEINEGDEIDPTEDAPSFYAFALNPVLIVDLIAGPLAGSVRDLGAEEINGVRTTHYRANFDIEKVLKDTRRKRFPEEVRDAFEDVLKVLAVSGTIHKGEVWLDGDGLPRRFTIRLKEEPIRHFVFEHTITLDLSSFGAASAVDVPDARERIDVRSIVQYLRATIPSPRTPEFLTFLGIAPTTTATTVAP